MKDSDTLLIVVISVLILEIVLWKLMQRIRSLEVLMKEIERDLLLESFRKDDKIDDLYQEIYHIKTHYFKPFWKS